MTKRARKDRLSNWDFDGSNDVTNYQDDDISERSSITSLEGHFRQPPEGPTTAATTINNPNKQEEYQDPYYTGEGPHTLRYFYNELPDAGVPMAVQAKEAKKEEKQKIKDEIEARRGRGALVEGPGMNPPTEMNDNYYPYWYYYKAKNPDWIMRQQQYADATFMPALDPTKKIDLADPEEFPVSPKLTKATRKARDFLYTGRDTPNMIFNQERRRYEMLGEGKDKKSGLPTDGDKNKQGGTSKQYIPLKDGGAGGGGGGGGAGAGGPNSRRNGTYSRTDPRGKLQTEYDWAEHYTNYMRNKSSMDYNYKPNIRMRNHRSRKDYDPLNGIYGKDDPNNMNKDGFDFDYDDDDEYGNGTGNGNRRRGNNRNGYGRNGNYRNGNGTYNGNQRSTSQFQQYNTYSSNPYSNQQGSFNQNRSAPHNGQRGIHRHTHNHSTHHNLSSKDFNGGKFKVNDTSLDKSTANFRTLGLNPSGYGPPSIYNQSNYLPPITRDYFDRPHPIGYYGTQVLTNDYNTLSYGPQIYKAGVQTKFYDRYLNNVIDKRLFA
ncbi:unnamed protein product [Adineta steineri]|uniref:Uncharacterized protein n=1 Tax=Adineta steineri TaxID=433720 RepID=A0A814B8X8_9BILA|nr:unnamed protein product [Adineta steineri]CAF3581274.1 unnamed protein product [Adineta steineri]